MTFLRRFLGFSIAIVLMALACGEDSECPTCPQGGFAFRIGVRDGSGMPVGGLRASLAYPPLPATGPPGPLAVQGLPPTTVQFTAPESALVDLEVLDLDRRLVAQPLTAYPARSGTYNVVVVPDAPHEVYWIRLVARREDAVVFRDSLLAAWWPLDTSNVLGTTDSTGVLQTQDPLRFPNVLDLPPLVRTNAWGDTIGTFSYPDTVALILTAPPGGPIGQLSVYRLVVRPGGNDFALTWPNGAGPAASGPWPAHLDPAARTAPRSVLDDPPVVGPPTEWRLFQNTPNPVN